MIHLADDVGTPIFKFLETPTGIGKLLLITSLVFLVLMVLLAVLLLLLRKRFLKNEPSGKVFEDPFLNTTSSKDKPL